MKLVHTSVITPIMLQEKVSKPTCREIGKQNGRLYSGAIIDDIHSFCLDTILQIKIAYR